MTPLPEALLPLLAERRCRLRIRLRRTGFPLVRLLTGRPPCRLREFGRRGAVGRRMRGSMPLNPVSRPARWRAFRLRNTSRQPGFRGRPLKGCTFPILWHARRLVAKAPERLRTVSAWKRRSHFMTVIRTTLPQFRGSRAVHRTWDLRPDTRRRRVPGTCLLKRRGDGKRGQNPVRAPPPLPNNLLSRRLMNLSAVS